MTFYQQLRKHGPVNTGLITIPFTLPKQSAVRTLSRLLIASTLTTSVGMKTTLVSTRQSTVLANRLSRLLPLMMVVHLLVVVRKKSSTLPNNMWAHHMSGVVILQAVGTAPVLWLMSTITSASRCISRPLTRSIKGRLLGHHIRPAICCSGAGVAVPITLH